MGNTVLAQNAPQTIWWPARLWAWTHWRP